MIEQARVGGTCITVGCIPTKTWVQTAHALKDASQTFAQLGVNVSGVEHDFATTQKNKETIVGALVNGITGFARANGMESSPATAASRMPTRSRSRAGRTSR